MDLLFSRIKKLDPENVSKVMGYLLLQDRGDQELGNLALSPDSVIEGLIYQAKAELSQFSIKLASPPISPSTNSPPLAEFPSQFSPLSTVSPQPFMSTGAFLVPAYHVASKHNSDFMLSELQNQAQFLSLEDQIESVNFGNVGYSSDYIYSDAALGNLSGRTGRRHEFPVKVCHYFNKGFCKHGNNCRYVHPGQGSDRFSQMCDLVGEDQLSLEKLEFEIIELLQSKKGHPVSIASLPMIYYDRYRKVLQADGYLTESQRHGKAGYSLTKLLARLKSIRLIDRPHGQHAVILAEDAPMFLDYLGDRNDPGPIVSGSRQIYLTFPAESTFSEDDVASYFSTYGPVEDVRIPCQEKRMFGFVTFESADTVKTILAKGNPHFVCGARVLVKPYREKSKLIDRKYQESYSFRPVDMDAELHSMRRRYEAPRLLRKQLLEEQQQEQALELERRRLEGLQIARRSMANQSYFGYSMDGLKVPEENIDLPYTERFSYVLDVLNSGGERDNPIQHAETNYTDQNSIEEPDLPESPFASPEDCIFSKFL